jgi:hypothetical protein
VRTVAAERDAARENGSRLSATSWLPRTTYGCRRRARNSLRRASPRGCETRSPVTQTRSGRLDATQSTARALARLPHESGAPRWKSDRWPMRSPSRALGSPSMSTSSTRVRSQPASNQPYPMAMTSAVPTIVARTSTSAP